MPEIKTILSPEQERRLQAAAERRGVSVEALAAEMIERELKARTKPKFTGGKVRPFKRP